MRKTFTLRYDPRLDVITIGGTRFAGEMLRLFWRLPVGSTFELVARDDGVITLRVLDPEATPVTITDTAP